MRAHGGIIAAYAAILLIGGAGITGVQLKYHQDLQSSLQQYRIESHQKTLLISKKLEDSFLQMYQSLRTMARLPGVRSIDRYATNFDGDAKTTVQELYNNIASNVAVSEIYIVPRDINPDKIDQHTHKPEIPITTFDQLIVNKNADSSDHEHSQVEEIEIYEYRTMRSQLAYLSKTFAKEAGIHALDYPAMAGPEVITCDNSRYRPSAPNDADRSGLVYSVPFYSSSGDLKGCISAVILTHALRDLIPSGDYVWLNMSKHYKAVPNQSGVWNNAKSFIDKGSSDTNLLYSEVLPLKIVDLQGDWHVWAGRPNSDYWLRSDVQHARFSMLIGTCGITAAMIALVAIVILVIRNRRIVERKNTELELRVSERTKELTESKQGLDETVANLKDLAIQVAKSSDQVAQASKIVAESADTANVQAKEIADHIQSISLASDQSAKGASEVAAGSVSQAYSLSIGSSRVVELLTSVHSVSEAAIHAVDVALQTTESATQGSKAVENTIIDMNRISHSIIIIAEAIDHLRKSSEQIGSIIEVIDEIADQTNLLALNAAIEAARAGESGKGFAVVAEEVRKLATRSRSATYEIGKIIYDIQNQTNTAKEAMDIGKSDVNEGVMAAEAAGKVLDKIEHMANAVTTCIQSIVSATVDMTNGADNVAKTITESAAVSEENSAIAGEMSTAAKGISSNIQVLGQLIERQNHVVYIINNAANDLDLLAHELHKNASIFNGNEDYTRSEHNVNKSHLKLIAM